MLLATLLACAAQAASTAPQAAPPAPAGSGPRVVLVGLDGKETVRELAGFDTDDPRQLGAWRVRFEGLEAPVAAAGDLALAKLWSGEELQGRIKGGQGDLVDFETRSNVLVALSIEELESLRFPARVPELWTRPLEAAAEGDRLYRSASNALDLLEGGLESFGASDLTFHDDRVGRKTIPWREVAALFVDRSVGQEFRARERAQGLRVVLDLADQSRLAGVLVRAGARGVELRRELGEKVLVEAQAVRQLVVDDGRFAFLSTLPVLRAEDCKPFGDELGMRWAHKLDLNVDGGPLSAGGRTWSRGIGMHAPSRVAWKLDGTWKSFSGAVAVDDGTRKLPVQGSVVFRVIADGRKLWESPLVRTGDAPLAVGTLALSGVRELVLEVDAGGDGFAADRADWLEPVLVR